MNQNHKSFKTISYSALEQSGTPIAKRSTRETLTFLVYIIISFVPLIFLLIVSIKMLLVVTTNAITNTDFLPSNPTALSIIGVLYSLNIIFIALLIHKIISLAQQAYRNRKSYVNLQPVYQLATDNGWSFYAGKYTPELRGYFFRQSVYRAVYPVITVPTDNLFLGQPELDFGNFYFTLKPRHKYDAEQRGFVGLTLSRKMPHIIIAQQSRGFINKPKGLIEKPKSNQKSDIAYAFDQKYSIYLPKNYERDVYEILTPDLMDILLRLSSSCNFEIIDNRLYAYKNNSFNLFVKESYSEIFQTILVIAALIDDKAKKYYDWRTVDLKKLGEPARTTRVSKLGLRLRTGWLGEIRSLITDWRMSIDQHPISGTLKIIAMLIITFIISRSIVITLSVAIVITIIIGQASRVLIALIGTPFILLAAMGVLVKLIEVDYGWLAALLMIVMLAALYPETWSTLRELKEKLKTTNTTKTKKEQEIYNFLNGKI